MTKPQLAALARGLAPVLREFFAEVLARVEAKERGLDGKDGARGPEGPEGKPGRDGRDGLPGVQGEKGLDGTNGKDGADGLGFDDLTIVHDGDRNMTFRFIKGDRIREFPVKLSHPLYQGIWGQDGRKDYERGDEVTFGNQTWIALADNANEKPGVSKVWRLAARKGSDGHEGKPGPEGPRGPKGDKGEPGIFR